MSAEITEADWLEGRDNWRERYGRALERQQPSEDVFGITHGATVEQAVGFVAAQLQTLNEAVPTIRRLEGVIEQKANEEK